MKIKKALIKNSVSMNSRDFRGQTPAHLVNRDFFFDNYFLRLKIFDTHLNDIF